MNRNSFRIPAPKNSGDGELEDKLSPAEVAMLNDRLTQMIQDRVKKEISKSGDDIAHHDKLIAAHKKLLESIGDANTNRVSVAYALEDSLQNIPATVELNLLELIIVTTLTSQMIGKLLPEQLKSALKNMSREMSVKEIVSTIETLNLVNAYDKMVEANITAVDNAMEGEQDG